MQLILFAHHLLFLVLLFLSQGVPCIRVPSLIASFPLTSQSALLLSRHRKSGVNWYQFCLLSDSVFFLLSSVPIEENKFLPLFIVH